MKQQINEKQQQQHHDLQLNKLKICSSPVSEHFTAYAFLMEKIKSVDMGFSKNKLRQNGIELTNNFVEMTSLNLVYLNRDSATLQVSFGNFQTNVTVFRMILEQHETFEQNFIGSGPNSIIYKINVNNCLYACKSIAVNESNNFYGLSHVCKEYVLTKIAGILEIGPQVKPAFGYDIVCFKNRATFAMELCQTNISIESDLAKEQLLSGLRLLHSLKICHGDIKLENMAYSKITSKHIFIDFGLSKNIREEIGRKTWTKFFGTYKYASPELKKSYFFSAFVDLYYNDAYCLNYFFGEAQAKKKINIDFDYKQKNEGILPCQVAAIITIRYLLFNGKFDLALNRILVEKGMAKSVLKIFIQEFYMKRKEHSLEMDDYLKLLKSNVENNKNCQTMIDNILSTYLQRFYNKQLDSKFVNITAYIESDLSIELVWQEELWMDEITIFLEADPKNDEARWTREDFLLRKKLIDKIFKFLGHSCSLSEENCAFLFKFRTVLTHLHEYYKSKENLRFLEAIRNLFIKIDAYPDQYKVQLTILQLYIKLGKPRDQIAIKKIQFLLYRQFSTFPSTYSFQDTFQINNTKHPQFIQPFTNDPTTIESLFNQLVSFDFRQTGVKKRQQILAFMDRALNEQQQMPIKKAASDVIQFCKSQWELPKMHYNLIQNRNLKLLLKKKFCFFNVGASEIFLTFQEDLYLSNIRGYFQIFKNIHSFSLAKGLQACNEYFQVFCTQLQFFPYLLFIIFALHKYNYQHRIIISFISLFTSSFQQLHQKTKTYAFQYIKFIFKQITFFYRYRLLENPAFSHLLQNFTTIFNKCHSKIRRMVICSYEVLIIQFCSILVKGLKKSKFSLALEILQFSKKVTPKELIMEIQLHSIVEMMSVSWQWLSQQPFNYSDTLQQIENLIISISQKSLQLSMIEIFSEYQWNSSALQKILQKRKLHKKEFYFLISMTVQKDKFMSDHSESTYLKIDLPYDFFVNNVCADDLVKIAETICESCGIKTIVKHCHLSGLYMGIYLKTQNILSMEQKRKLLIVIAFGLPNIVSAVRKNLLLSIFYKKHCRVFDGKSERKQLICLRHEGRHRRSMKKWGLKAIMCPSSYNKDWIMYKFEMSKRKYLCL